MPKNMYYFNNTPSSKIIHWSWLGYVRRMRNLRHPKQVLDFPPVGRQRPRRPLKWRWKVNRVEVETGHLLTELRDKKKKKIYISYRPKRVRVIFIASWKLPANSVFVTLWNEQNIMTHKIEFWLWYWETSWSLQDWVCVYGLIWDSKWEDSPLMHVCLFFMHFSLWIFFVVMLHGDFHSDISTCNKFFILLTEQRHHMCKVGPQRQNEVITKLNRL
jgi:hypothetical protein